MRSISRRQTGSGKGSRVGKTAIIVSNREKGAAWNTLKWLQSVVRGYFQYHAIPGNWERLEEFRKNVLRLWHRSLRRRSHKSRWTWTRFRQFLVDQVPEVRILHPFPDVRFDAKHSR